MKRKEKRQAIMRNQKVDFYTFEEVAGGYDYLPEEVKRLGLFRRPQVMFSDCIKSVGLEVDLFKVYLKKDVQDRKSIKIPEPSVEFVYQLLDNQFGVNLVKNDGYWKNRSEDLTVIINGFCEYLHNLGHSDDTVNSCRDSMERWLRVRQCKALEELKNQQEFLFRSILNTGDIEKEPDSERYKFSSTWSIKREDADEFMYYYIQRLKAFIEELSSEYDIFYEITQDEIDDNLMKYCEDHPDAMSYTVEDNKRERAFTKLIDADPRLKDIEEEIKKVGNPHSGIGRAKIKQLVIKKDKIYSELRRIAYGKDEEPEISLPPLSPVKDRIKRAHQKYKSDMLEKKFFFQSVAIQNSLKTTGDTPDAVRKSEPKEDKE